jgi:hypothetical protein
MGPVGGGGRGEVAVMCICNGREIAKVGDLKMGGIILQGIIVYNAILKISLHLR